MTDSEIFETEIKCIQRRSSGQCNGGTDCCNCDLLMNEKDIISAYERAITNNDLINRLQAENKELLGKIEKLEEKNKILDLNRRMALLEKEPLYENIKTANAEIKRLSHKCGECAGCTRWKCDCANIKAEAYKEFAERLKEYIYPFKYSFDNVIDNLLKEMVGEDK